MKTIYLLVKNGDKTYFNRAGIASRPDCAISLPDCVTLPIETRLDWLYRMQSKIFRVSQLGD